MGDSNKVHESGTGKTEDYNKNTDEIGLIDLTQNRLKDRLFKK